MKMRRSIKTIALAICLVMALVLVAACGSTDPAPVGQQPPGTTPPGTAGPGTGDGGSMLAPAPTEPDVIFAEHIDVILPNENFASLNPFSTAANNTATDMVFFLNHNRLLERDAATGDYLPSLATSWSSDDFRTFTFTLRDDVYFHNGDKFTAQDVIYTVELAREIGAGSQGAAQWAPIESIRALDPYKIEMVLNRVNVDFYFNMTMPSAGILNRRAIEADQDTGTWVGTGPFVVSEFVSSDLTRLVRNDNYWDTDKSILTQSLTIRFVAEMGVRAVRLQNGESQLSFGTSAEDLPMFMNNPDYSIIPHTFNSLTGISFNLNHPLMADYNFRQAVMYAVDRDEIGIFATGEGGALPGCQLDSGTIWGFQTEFRNTNIPVLQQDLARAREFLAQSSYNGEEVEIAAAIATSVRGAQALQEQLRLIGINTNLQQMDTAGLTAYVLNPEGGSQLVFHSLAMNLSSSSYRLAFYPGGPQNRMHYNNPIVTQMLDEAGAMTDINARRNHFLRIQEIIAEDPPFFNMYHRVNPVVAASGIGGVGLSAENRWIDLREIYLVVD